LRELHKAGPLPDVRKFAPQVPDDVAAVIAQCVHRDPAVRPQDGQALFDLLRRLVGNIRSMETLMKEALRGTGLRLKVETEGYSVHVPVKASRRQRVFIREARTGLQCERIVRLFSVCGPFVESYMHRALRLNREITFGALAIEEIDDEPHFIMTKSFPRATCDPEEILYSIQSIGQWADHVEEALTGEDLR
jgi:hypothetical protein